MKIICYINKISGGGAERVMSVLANGLARKKHQVTLVADYATLDEYALDEVVDRIVLDGAMSEKKQNGAARTISRIRRLRKIYKEKEADIIISFMRLAMKAASISRFSRRSDLFSSAEAVSITSSSTEFSKLSGNTAPHFNASLSV